MIRFQIARPALPAVLMLCAMLLAGAALAADPTEEWAVTYDGGDNAADNISCVLVDPQDNLVVGGESYDGIDGSDMFIRKLSRTDGSQMWMRRVPAPDGNDMALTDMAWDPFNDILIGGYVRGCVG